MFRSFLKAVGACVLAGTLVSLSVPVTGRAYATTRPLGEVPQAEAGADYESLSPYWHAKVLRWEALIVQEANRRELDPDLVASLVWMESRGDAKAVGPVGSVGLMQVMPKEAGFSWRPSRDELLDPFTNVFWGTRTLSTIIRQGNGDVFNALAAYNGGWEKISSRVPKAFAATILHDYASAVARRHGVVDPWSAFIAIQDTVLHGPIWGTNSGSGEVLLYGDENATPEGTPLIPPIAPTAEVAASVGTETSQAYTVGIWLYRAEAHEWVTAGAVPVVDAGMESAPDSPSVMAGSQRPEVSQASPSAEPPAAVPPVAVKVTPLATSGGAPGKVSSAPSATVTPATCAGGSLVLDAYPLERYNTVDGWAARVYASARGGDCTYDYAWNTESETRGTGYSGPIVFEVRSSRRGAVIVGTVLATSNGDTVRVGLYIVPPGD